MATVGTHDVPPVSGFVTGDQVTVRARLGLLEDPAAERDRAKLALALWRDALGRECLLPPDQQPTIEEFTVALYGYLALTPAVLLGVSLADAVGDRRTQNVPGTSEAYPNWQIPLCDGAGEPVLIEDLDQRPLVRSIVDAVVGSGTAASRAGRRAGGSLAPWRRRHGPRSAAGAARPGGRRGPGTHPPW